MIDYQKLKGLICPLSEVKADMENGLPPQLVHEILRSVDITTIGKSEYVNRAVVDRQVAKLLGIRKEYTPRKGTEENDKEIEELERKVAEYESEIKKKERTISDLTAAARQFDPGQAQKPPVEETKEYKELLKKLNDKQVEYSDLAKSLTEWKQGANVNRDRATDAQNKLSVAEKNCSSLEEKLKISNSKNITLEAENKRLKGDNQNLQSILEKNATLLRIKCQKLNDYESGKLKPAEPKEDNSPKAVLKNEIRELCKERDAALSRISTLQEENETLKNNLVSAQESNKSESYVKLVQEHTALQSLLDDVDKENTKQKEQIKQLELDLKSAREDINIHKNRADSLQESLNAKQQERSDSNIANINEYYAGEIMDFIAYLASSALSTVDVKKDKRLRFVELCQALTTVGDGGEYQKQLKLDIADAIKAKFDKDSDSRLRSLGFEKVSEAPHEKFAHTVLGDKYTLVVPTTPSDRRAVNKAISVTRNMLTFGADPKESENA